MEIQLLTNEDFIKSLCPIDANIAGEYMTSAMFEAQEIGLKSILGSRLLASLKAHESAGDWADAPMYKLLKEECQFYLAYKSIAYLIGKVSYKVANKGAISTNDERVNNLPRFDSDALTDDYESKAAYFCNELQRWILARACEFSELDECACNEIRANLRSATSCGIWLGGNYGV